MNTLSLDSRKLSFYSNGVRVMPKSVCLSECPVCMNQSMVTLYDQEINNLISAGPEVHHVFIDAQGIATIFLNVFALFALILAVYYLRKFYNHKYLHLYADTYVGIIVGSLVLMVSSGAFLFSPSSFVCNLQVTMPSKLFSVYSKLLSVLS